MGLNQAQQSGAWDFKLKWKAKPDNIDDNPNLYKEDKVSDQAVHSNSKDQQDQRAEEDICQDHKEQSGNTNRR